MTQVNDKEHVILDPLCDCGSTVTVRRREFESWGGGAVHFEAWCTENPGRGHPVPDVIAAEVKNLNAQEGKG